MLKRCYQLISLMLLLCLCSFSCKQEAKKNSTVQSRSPLEVSSQVDKAVATTGDIITYTVIVDRLPEVEAQIPEFGAEVAGFRIVDMGTEGPKEIEGRVVTKKWYKLRADMVGSYIIPPVSLSYKPNLDAALKEIQTPQIFVEVKSAIPAGEEQQDIIDIKSLEEPQIDYVLWSGIIGGVVILLLLIVLGVIYYRKRKRAGEVVVKPLAHEVALAELNKLKGKKHADVQEIKKMYFRLSEIFRCYLEDRYSFPATDWTTEEIISQANRNQDLTFELKEQAKTFLLNTDIVKFAEYVPEETQMHEELGRAISFVTATKEVIMEEARADAV